MKRIVLYIIAVLVFLCGISDAQTKDITEPASHALATDSAVYMFVNVLPMDGVAGFMVYRADEPIAALNREHGAFSEKSSSDLKTGLDSAHRQILDKILEGKTLDELQKEIEELEKTDPQAAEKRKQEIKAAIEQNIRDYETASEKLQHDSKNALDQHHEDYKNKVENAIENGPAPEDFKLLTDTPVTPFTDDQKIMDELNLVDLDSLKAMGLQSASELVTKYDEHKGNINLLLLHSLPVNRIMGRVYEDTTVTPGNGYVYRVDLVDDKGNVVRSLPPITVIAQPNPPATPTGFIAEAKSDHVELRWDKPSNIPTGWIILRSDSSRDAEFTKINPGVISSIGKSIFKDYSVKPGMKLSYKLFAVDTVGNRSIPAESPSFTFVDIVPPAPPTGVKAVLKNGRISLTWPRSRETDLAGYNVYRSNTPDGDFKLLTDTSLAADAVEHISDVNVPGTVHYYRITALDTTGNESAPSHLAWVVPPDTLGPDSISDLSVEQSGPDSVTLTWTCNEPKDMHGYHIYRGYSKDSLKKIHTSVIPKGTYSYEDSNLRPGETYYYAVAGVDINMNEGALSGIVEVVAPDSEAPLHPANIAAAPGDGMVTLSWPANHEPDVAAYHLYRSNGENSPFSRIFISDAATTQYVDKDVENGLEYMYFIKAVDSAGNESAQSHTAYATPRDTAAPAAPRDTNVEVSAAGVTISWKAPNEHDIVGYLVLRAQAETAVYETITDQPVTNNSYTDTTAAGECWYKIVAVDTSGNRSPRSNAAGPVILRAGK